MKFIETLQSKEIKEKTSKAKFVLFGFVLVLALFYFAINCVKVGAVSTTISGTQYIPSGGSEAKDYISKELETKEGDLITFVQGNGQDDKVSLKFTIKDFPEGATAFAIAETEHTDSNTGDLDRYSKEYIEGGYKWKPSESNPTKNGVKGSATVRFTEGGKVEVDVVYVLRIGDYGMKFLKVYFYNSNLETCTEDNGCASSIEVVYVISQPINELPTAIRSEQCYAIENLNTICIEYDADAAERREPRALKVYLPATVAYDFVKVDGVGTNNYTDSTKTTIYAINYFHEENEEITIVDDIDLTDEFLKSYLYTNFEYGGKDTVETAKDLKTPFTNYRNTFKINDITNIEMEVDAVGTYFFYLTDIFGNVTSDVKQKVENVKNRTIYTKISKGNRNPDVEADDWGYDDVEVYTNESVAVTLTMTVETKFEYGECLDGKCTKVTRLTQDQVAQIKYWRVEIEEDDPDAYYVGTTETYADEKYAYNNEFKFLICNSTCKSSNAGAEVLTYNPDLSTTTDKNSEGYSKFEGNTLTMYLSVNGRYRFYIEDTNGNNTWGDKSSGELAAMEYRNPRVELYGIDKYAPEITFDHNGTIELDTGETFKMFDVETFEYYTGIDTTNDKLVKEVVNGATHYTYTDVKTGGASAGQITAGIYYPVNVDAGRGETSFSDAIAKLQSHVVATERVMYYDDEDGNARVGDEYSSYSVYEREDKGSGYYKSEYDNTRVNTISKNTKHNSNGLKNGDAFDFTVEYYHNDATTKICEYLGNVEGYSEYEDKDALYCVNYYLDHGVDFVIKFGATDSVGNTGYSKVYVNVVDTTTPGFTQMNGEDGTIDLTKAVKTSNIGTDCRMEIGSQIGFGLSQNKDVILNCYNVILNEVYNFEDNVYDVTDATSGLKPYNRINSDSYVRLFIKSDVLAEGQEEYEWVNLGNSQFIPNKTGWHDLKIEIYDNVKDAEGTNVLTVIVSYYVDKKIVLVKPVDGESKFYGDDDPASLNYCVYMNRTNDYDAGYFENPYENLDTVFGDPIYCTNDGEDKVSEGKDTLFQKNVTNTDFGGALTRLESLWYNSNYTTALGAPSTSDAAKNIENNYVGLYNIILGTLNIYTIVDGEITNSENEDYVVKIHPSYRDASKYNGDENSNLIQEEDYFEDDLAFAQSSVKFTIKQVTLNVKANGGEKNYGDPDTNSGNFNKDDASTGAYLNGFSFDEDELKYQLDKDNKATLVLGVLRRTLGENVGNYAICNYRGTDNADNVIENVNNMYLNCADTTASGANPGAFTYDDGIIVMDGDYIKSRALYIATNKRTTGKTINVTTDERNNKYANYVIIYTQDVYTIKPIDLVLQALPGQRREYNRTNIQQPDPWEIILYGLVENKITRSEADTDFNGYTVTIEEYDESLETERLRENGNAVSKLAANKPEEREQWKLIHNGVELLGKVTNDSNKLLRSTKASSIPGSGELTRENKDVYTGGWYLYNSLINDVYVGAKSTLADGSDIAVVTNGNNQCSYDLVNGTGHIVLNVNGTSPCKNYNLIYNGYYTNAAGYTFETKAEGEENLNQFIYKSAGKLCTELDPGLPCSEANKYKIQFEIYRREIIMEFNSAIEEILLSGTGVTSTEYGNRYNFYKTNFFDIDFYKANNKNNGQTIHAEDYLFICYKNDNTRSDFNADNSGSTGCSGDPSYGLTQGDTWWKDDNGFGLGLEFWMHELVSDESSGYYSDTDKAIPAGVYYMYAKIAEDQEKNYNFKYKGGTMTIKSKSIGIDITSFVKEYGEAYYTKYGTGADYTGSDFFSFANLCLNDGLFINGEESLIKDINCNGAQDELDKGNTIQNIYGFVIDGLDSMDTIAANFKGRPDRDRTTSDQDDDVNGLQDNVGIYVMDQGTIHAIVNNPFNTSNACIITDLKNAEKDCVVANGNEYRIENYLVNGETRRYIFDMHGIDDKTVSYTGNGTVNNGSVIITPATLKITVTSGQTKMYGCAYNTVNTTANLSSYSYADGYSNCVEGMGEYYDLGYEYRVSGDKDYRITKEGYKDGLNDEYSTNGSYTVSGIKGSSTFRKTKAEEDPGIKSHALNEFGTLYRIPYTEEVAVGGVVTSKYVTAAEEAQKSSLDERKYQGQSYGDYVITLGNVDVTINGSYAASIMANKCDSNNMPSADGSNSCKNYNIDFYGTKVNASTTEKQKYVNGSGEFPSELIFNITKRKVYVYTDYDQKIYGDDDQSVSYLCGDYNNDGKIDENDNVLDGNGNTVNGDVFNHFCKQADVDTNTDADDTNDVEYEYGLTRYYTKGNSLAKYPWNSNTENRDDVQHDIIGGKISRKGELVSEGVWNAPKKDDSKGFYEYSYDDVKYKYNDADSVVSLNSYGSGNYNVNFYNEDGLAVNIDGVVRNTDGDKEVIKFEIVLREIKVAFVSFDKMYGEQDDVRDYNILVCAPSEEFDFATMKCKNKSSTDRHGLSESHLATYVTSGVLNQALFKNDFGVRFMRVLGENVSCGTASSVTAELNGYFYGDSSEVLNDGTVYKKTLKCNTTAVEGKSVYETLAYIDQSEEKEDYGYNYKVNYTIGYVNIVKRNILITPDEGQGFEYGDYYDTLIPAITFTTSLDTDNVTLTTRADYGLVNDSESEDGICLQNINYYNKPGGGSGTCFYINDRQDEYDSKTSKTTSAYNAGEVNSNTGLENVSVKHYVFGDIYTREVDSRSALDRTFSTTTPTSERYNRSVGEYTIVLNKDLDGYLRDKTGNYEIAFVDGVKYTITEADIRVTPDSTIYAGTTQTNQYKIYGEKDKELTFAVATIYTVKHEHYSKYLTNIETVCPKDNGACVNNEGLRRYSLGEDGISMEEDNEGAYILLKEGDIVTIAGYAYGEDAADSTRNYGQNKTSNKTNSLISINQSSVVGSKYYDIVCNEAPEDISCNSESEITYGTTNRILLGYLYVSGYAQAAGTYEIVSGLKEALNEWGENNYKIQFVDDVQFTIIPRPVGVQIYNVVKTYGQATDIASCENLNEASCTLESGILTDEQYLKYNFKVENLTPDKIESIIGGNKTLYNQNSKFANGLLPASQYSYSAYTLSANTAEQKNANHLGVYVGRDVKNTSNNECRYNGDKYGLCEDAGEYYLRFYGYDNTIDSSTVDGYNLYRPKQTYTFKTSIEGYYYNMYFGYNPNYFVVVLDEDSGAIEEDDLFVAEAPSSGRTIAEGDKFLTSTATLTINKKEVKIFVNTRAELKGANPEIYYVQQNSTAPKLPTIDETKDLKFEIFNTDMADAVYNSDSYGKVIWGRQPSQVRTGDKLEGELAYCNKIISLNDYNAIKDGLSTDYSCSDLVYDEEKEKVKTQLQGYVPIVRDTAKFSIVSQTSSSPNSDYENNNYTVMFYPGALRIEEDDTKPIVQVNRENVYIEANAVGEYIYECVASNQTTTYTDCEIDGVKYSVSGKTELIEGDPILKYLKEDSVVIKAELPKIPGCGGENTYECTASEYYELNNGKGKDGFSNTGLVPGQENAFVSPFTMYNSNLEVASPSNFKELIITLVKWFGVTAYDASEIRNGEYLEKKFDRYWYLVIEKTGTNGEFDISRIGKYKVHFYVMDNAGNVSEDGNEGTLHIIDTTNPIVGTLNLYNGRVECTEEDCTIENNWVVKEDTYLPINALVRYDENGNPKGDGGYVVVDTMSNLQALNSLTKYTKVVKADGTIGYAESDFGKYILIKKGNNALAIKHYGWTNSSVGVYMTITGGSDNSYSETAFPSREAVDNSQWNHYYSRDGGITWFLYDRTNKDGVLALDADGTRQILIKAVDKGVSINSISGEKESTYCTVFYKDGDSKNECATMTYYEFGDTSVHDDELKKYEELSDEEKKTETNLNSYYGHLEEVGWNMSVDSENDTNIAKTISLLIYGKEATESGYEYYRDKKTAYLDRTSPTIKLYGEDLYLYEYGCGVAGCNNGYTEYYAGAMDGYAQNNKESTSGYGYDKNNSVFINHALFKPSGKHNPRYENTPEVRILSQGYSKLGSDVYLMNGYTEAKEYDIRTIYSEDRRYIIHAYDEENDDENYKAETHDLSSKIPTSTNNLEQDAASNIYGIIPHDNLQDYDGGDYTYSVIYSVMDKAGNESVYVARGIIFATLIPDIELESLNNQVDQVNDDTYLLNVNQGDDVKDIVESLSMKASTGIENKISYLTQTVYYNGNLLAEDQKYNPNIHESFNTMSPGKYEITYSLNYLYEKNGEYEMISAKPVKLIINVEATPPKVAETTNSHNYLNMILIIGALLGFMFIGFVSVVNKRKI